MLFAIQIAAMDGIETVLNDLDAILERTEHEVHEMDIIQADELDNSQWYDLSRPGRRKVLEEIAAASLYRTPRTRGPHLRRIEVSDEASAAQARHLANTPLLVLAENDVSDGALVEAALRVHAAKSTTELCFGSPSKLTPPAFQIESRGGHGELPKLIAARLADAAERGRPHRLLVVTDSDGESPGEVKAHAINIRQLCVDNSIPCPLLNKRTAENYIPDAVWNEWITDRGRTNMKSAVEAFLRLSPEQRDYIDMASPAESLASTQPTIEPLFKSVSVDDRKCLDKPVNLKGKGDARMILVLRDHAPMLTADDLKTRDHKGDLLALVRQIEDEL